MGPEQDLSPGVAVEAGRVAVEAGQMLLKPGVAVEETVFISAKNTFNSTLYIQYVYRGPILNIE